MSVDPEYKNSVVVTAKVRSDLKDPPNTSGVEKMDIDSTPVAAPRPSVPVRHSPRKPKTSQEGEGVKGLSSSKLITKGRSGLGVARKLDAEDDLLGQSGVQRFHPQVKQRKKEAVIKELQ